MKELYLSVNLKFLEKYPDIKFKIIGKGIETANIEKLVKKNQSGNIDFQDWVKPENLSAEIAEADICLGGHFGNTSKAARVISGKTYQFIAMKKADCLENTKIKVVG